MDCIRELSHDPNSYDSFSSRDREKARLDTLSRLSSIQLQLNFQSVKKEKDEPRCLGALLSLDVRQVTPGKTADELMALF